jgi:molybdopterin synthase sulfur carrier subunit
VPVEVRLPTILRQHAGGQSSVKANGSTIGEVFEDLIRQFPLLAGQVVTEDGSLHKFVNVYRNDDDVRYLDRLDTKVSDTDVISILPAVAGGAGPAPS